MEFKKDKSGAKIKLGDIVRIVFGQILTGEVKQLAGGQLYIDHEKVCLKYRNQIHCEVCESDSPPFYIDFFEPRELEIIGNANRKLTWQSSTLQQPDVWTDRTDEEYELMNHLARFNWQQIEK